VTGYPRQLLIMERFGYPDFLTASADELVDGQYDDRPGLRRVHGALWLTVAGFDGVEIQARKTKISLMTPRRKFGEFDPRRRRAWTCGSASTASDRTAVSPRPGPAKAT
jgi:hypothetical protein